MLAKPLNIFFCTFMLCVTATAVIAVPTVGDSGPVSLSIPDQGRNMSLSTSAMTISSEPELASIGKKFLQPPNIISGMKNTDLRVDRSLPSVPAAVLLGLVGFLCVTGIKDRKEWLTALATIIWLSQTGITAIPKLLPNHQIKKHTKHSSCLEKGDAYLLENSSRLRSEVEGSEYINLIHYLSSIPDGHSSATDNIDTAQPAIVFKRSALNLHLHCSAVAAEQFTCFSPAFIFSNQSRGPPKAFL